MDKNTAAWLHGQIDALHDLANRVCDIVKLHSTAAATELFSIRFACNRAVAAIIKETRKPSKRKAAAKAGPKAK